jgi:hypothetical protein
MLRQYTILFVGIAAILIACFLELSGVFLYFGYGVVRAGSTVLALVFLAWGVALWKRQSRGGFGCGLFVCIMFVALGWTVGTLVTSSRKRFYILAEQVRPGVSVTEVKAKMSAYRSWSTEEGYLSFGFASGPGTSDVLVVHFDPNSSKVLDADLSLD